MAVTIKLKRGTEAQVDAATLSDYEIAFCTDTKKIVVYDGTTRQKYLPAVGTDMSEVIADVVGAMVGSNTETGIGVSYDDNDSTLDFVLSYGTEPPAVSSSTSGTAGDSNSVSRSNHSHDLGTHTHADATAGGTIAHTALTSIGTNTHAQIDTFISSKAGASGLASLDASSLVVQNPANATATPTASKIPIADGSGKLDGWITYGTGANTACQGNDSRLPTSTEKSSIGTLVSDANKLILGSGAGAAWSSGNSVMVGVGAGAAATTGTVTAIGYQAAASTTTVTTVAVGYQAGYSIVNGASGTFIGYQAGYGATGAFNTVVGYQASNASTDATRCCSFGYKALNVNTASENTAIGAYAALNNTSGNVVAVGYNAAYTNTTGTGLTCIGYKAGYSNSTGTNSTHLGREAGYSSAGGGCVNIGYQAGYSNTTANRLYISNSNTATPLIYGEFDNNLLKIKGAVLPSTDDTYDLGSESLRWDDIYATNSTIQTSDADRKDNITDINIGLEFINALRPVSFKWKDYSYTEQVALPISYDENGDPLPQEFEELTVEKTFTRKHAGLIAQEVKAVMDDLEISTTDFAGYVDTVNNGLALRYEEFIAPMIKSIQELSARVEALEA